jgi:hypothetical protein
MSDKPEGVAFSSDAIPTMTLSWHHLPLARLIHENFSVIMAYAFSTPVLSKWVDDNFRGEWKYLNKALFEMPVERANLALLEFATQFRLLDDHHKLSDYFKQTKYPPLGKVTKQDRTEEPLYFRDMTNKIMHSSKIEWKLFNTKKPAIICHSPDPTRWVSAEIEIPVLAFYCGGLMS